MFAAIFTAMSDLRLTYCSALLCTVTANTSYLNKILNDIIYRAATCPGTSRNLVTKFAVMECKRKLDKLESKLEEISFLFSFS